MISCSVIAVLFIKLFNNPFKISTFQQLVAFVFSANSSYTHPRLIQNISLDSLIARTPLTSGHFTRYSQLGFKINLLD